MPINRIPYPEALPTATTDYEKQNELLRAGFQDINEIYPVDYDNDVLPQGVQFTIGDSVYRVDTSDEVISGTPSNYVRVEPQGDGSTALASYVANLTGVTWNPAYNHYEDVSGNLYLFDEGLALIDGDISDSKTRWGMSRGLVLESIEVGIIEITGSILGNVNINGVLDVNAGASTIIAEFSNNLAAPSAGLELELAGTAAREYTLRASSASDFKLVIENPSSGSFNLDLYGRLAIDGASSILTSSVDTSNQRVGVESNVASFWSRMTFDGATDQFIIAYGPNNGAATNQDAMAVKNVRSGGDIYFETSIGEVSRWTSSGSVLIGDNTDNASGARLQLNGWQTITDTTPKLRLIDTNNPRQWTMELFGNDGLYFTDTTGGTFPFRLQNGAPSNSLLIDSTGAVLVGIDTVFSTEIFRVNGVSRFEDQAIFVGDIIVGDSTNPYDSDAYMGRALAVTGLQASASDDGWLFFGAGDVATIRPIIAGDDSTATRDIDYDVTNGYTFRDNVNFDELILPSSGMLSPLSNNASSTKTGQQLYNELSPFVPNVNDEIKIQAVVFLDPTQDSGRIRAVMGTRLSRVAADRIIIRGIMLSFSSTGTLQGAPGSTGDNFWTFISTDVTNNFYCDYSV